MLASWSVVTWAQRSSNTLTSFHMTSMNFVLIKSPAKKSNVIASIFG